jgi:hypothetical protein
MVSFRVRAPMGCLVFALSGAVGCDLDTQTNVVLENDYPASSSLPLVVYRAKWQAVKFTVPVAPGSVSDTQPTVSASPNIAYVILAPGWDPASAQPPRSLVVMQSRAGFSVHEGDTLHIGVDDTTFEGNCASGSPLSQAQADFITQLVFPGNFVSLRYDAASCTTTTLPP